MTSDEYATTCANHRPSLVNQALLYVGSHEQAEDIANHAIEKSFYLCASITRQSYRKYMWRAVRNASLNYLEMPRHEVETQLYVNEDGEALQDVVVRTTDDIRLDIIRALEALPLRLRAVAYQFYSEQWTQGEIAAQRRCSQMSISRMITEINVELRYYLRAYTGEICKGGGA